MKWKEVLLTDYAIGQMVMIRAVASVQYNEQGHRFITSWPIKPIFARIIGLHTVPLGTYCPFQPVLDTPLDLRVVEDVHLAVDHVEYLWQVRTGMRNKPLLIDNTYVLCRSDGRLPMMARKPEFLCQKGEQHSFIKR